MIVHLVLFEPREQITLDEQQKLLADLREAARAIPTVRRFRLGRRVRHGLPGYEQAMTTDFVYAAIVDFDDAAGLESYLRHPAHDAIGRHFTTSAAHALAYDFDMVEVGVRA